MSERPKKHSLSLFHKVFIGFVAAFFLTTHSPIAAEQADMAARLPIPRFASLRANEVNMRTGPGMRYPIQWVYKRKGLPVEITAEYDNWRRVRDPEGTEGWINKAELTGKRGAIITGAAAVLRGGADEKSEMLARLETGAVGQILSCAKDWCKAKFDGTKGYLPKTDFLGAYSEETFK